MLLTILCGILFIIIGIVAYRKPGLIWALTEQWKSYAASEPSDLYLYSTKFGGILFILMGIAAMILPFLLE